MRDGRRYRTRDRPTGQGLGLRKIVAVSQHHRRTLADLQSQQRPAQRVPLLEPAAWAIKLHSV
jgi:hypothetical protein